MNKGQKETLLAAGGGHEAAAPTPKSSQCLMGPLPEWVVGMSPGMSSCVSPPRICSAPRKILRLNPSRGSRLLQTPETFLKENHPKVPTVLPSPALPIQPVFTAAPLFVSMLWACHPYCLPGGGPTNHPSSAEHPLSSSQRDPFLSSVSLKGCWPCPAGVGGFCLGVDPQYTGAGSFPRVLKSSQRLN